MIMLRLSKIIGENLLLTSWQGIENVKFHYFIITLICTHLSFQVSKTEYENCNIGERTLRNRRSMVINCSQPESDRVRKYTLIFEKFSAFGGFQFEEGMSYYYISKFLFNSIRLFNDIAILIRIKTPGRNFVPNEAKHQSKDGSTSLSKIFFKVFFFEKKQLQRRELVAKEILFYFFINCYF